MLVHVHIAVALFLNSCPNKVMWNLRAQNMCGDQDKYMCLYDTNARKFMELCKDKPDFHRPGNIFVISGNLQYFAGRPCYYNRYQPHKWWTNGSHECQYLKSTCNEEGQVPYDNGTISRDRKCRCDYTNYYTFLNNTRSRCHCDPVEEDCSCYRKTCNTGEVLTPDYECVSVHAWTGVFVCPEHKAPRYSNEKTFQRRTTVCPSVKRDLSGTMQQSIARIAQTVMVCVIMMFGLMSLIVYAIKYKTSKLSKGMESKLEEITNKLKKFESHIGDMDQSTNNTADSPFDDLNRIFLENKLEACAIVLCILFGNEFNTDWLKSKLEAQDKKAKLQGIVNEFEINFYNETAIDKLISAFTSLHGTYLQGCFPRYKISNSKNYQQISVICGKSFTECFIKHGSSTLIRDHFLFDSIRGEQIQDGLITISKDNECLYFERLLSDLRKLKIKSTFENKQLKYPSFMNKLIRFFEKSEDTKQLLKNLDKNFRTVEEDDKNSRGSSATTPLIESASGGYVDIVYFLIDTVKSKVNNRDGEGRTALYKASEAGKTNVVQLLLEKYANVNQCNMHNESPLYVACKAKHCVIVDILLQTNANVDVNHCDKDGDSPLYVVCAHGYTDIVDMLLQTEVDVNQLNISKESPLYAACFGGYTDIVEKLLSKAANDNLCDIAGEYPLYVACRGGYADIVEMLLMQNSDVNKCDNNEQSPLYVACAGGYEDIVDMLLEKDADVYKCDKKEQSPLYVACVGGYNDIVEKLIMKESDVNNRDGKVETALYKASEEGNTNVVQLLLAKNVDVNQCNMHNESPLYVACKKKDCVIVDILLQNNASVSQCTTSNKSPLYEACTEGCNDIVELLLKQNADVNQCDDTGKSPLYMACANRNTDIVEVLLHKAISHFNAAVDESSHELVDPLLQNVVDVNRCDNDGESPLYAACARGYTDIVEILLKTDVDVNQCNIMGDSPLYVACISGYIEIVECLLSKAANVNICNLDGESPLHMACTGGHKDIVEMLLKKDADVTQCDNDKKSPLNVACGGGYTDIVEMLLKKNADVEQCDNYGKSPLNVACRGGYKDIVEMLLNAHANINQYYGEQQEFPLYLACAGGYKDIVEILSKNDANVCQYNSKEETPLFVACAMGYTDIVELLLQKNSNASQCNKSGASPLYVACAGGRTDTVKMLLQKDPDILQYTRPDKSPLHVVCDFDSFKHLQYSEHGKDVYEKKVKDHITIVELLISFNVDARQMDSKHQTPLDIANKSGCSELVNILNNRS